ARPSVLYFSMVENSWHEAPSWPPSGGGETLFLHSKGDANSAYGGGRLDAKPPETEHADFYSYCPDRAPAAPGGHSCCREDVAGMGGCDQRTLEELRNVLVYTGEPLKASTRLAGDLSVRLFTASDAPEARYTTRLNMVLDGRSVNLAEGNVD